MNIWASYRIEEPRRFLLIFIPLSLALGIGIDIGIGVLPPNPLSLLPYFAAMMPVQIYFTRKWSLIGMRDLTSITFQV